MKEFTSEMIEKAKAAKSVEELCKIAKENNVELTAEEASVYFNQLNPKVGELSDDELDNVAGGSCHTADGRLVVTVGYSCVLFTCKSCGGKKKDYGLVQEVITNADTDICTCSLHDCNHCKYMSYEGGKWLCNNPGTKYYV